MFQQFELGEVCSRLRSGKNISAKQVSDEGLYPVFGGNGLRGYTDTSNFSGECAIIGRQGAFCGNVRYFCGTAYMTEHAIIACAANGHNTRYLAYLLSTMSLGRLSAQSAQPGISVKTLSKQIVKLPSFDIQNKVVAILSSLEDKIDVNNRINDNLEQQLQAIYKSWFVDYEPFNGEQPTDWLKSDIYSIASIIYGAPFSSNCFNTKGTGKPIIRIRDLKDQMFVTYTTEVHPKGHLIRPGDIVVGMDGEFRPYIWGNTEAWLNQRVCIFERRITI